MSDLGGGTSGAMRGRAFWGFVALAIAVVAEVVWYPELATFVNSSMFHGGGAGSAVGFYRDVYVLPAAVAFAAGVVIGMMLVRRKHAERIHLLLYGAWAVNLLFLAFSLWFYLRGVATAGDYK